MKPALIDTIKRSTTIKTEETIDVHDIKARGQLDDLRNAGEICTLRAVTEFMLARVDPSLGSKETGRENVLDPACRTGGSLTATIVHFEKQLDTHPGPGDRGLFSFVDATILAPNGLGVPDRRWGAVQTVPLLLSRERSSAHSPRFGLRRCAESSARPQHRLGSSAPA